MINLFKTRAYTNSKCNFGGYVPSPSLSNKQKASWNSAICSSVSTSPILVWLKVSDFAKMEENGEKERERDDVHNICNYTCLYNSWVSKKIGNGKWVRLKYFKFFKKIQFFFLEIRNYKLLGRLSGFLEFREVNFKFKVYF